MLRSCPVVLPSSPCCASSARRVAQKLQDRHLEHPRVATTPDLPMVGASMAVDSPLVVVMEVLPLEGPMDTPVLGDSPLELQLDHMVVYLQGAPTVSHLRVPMVPSILDLMDRVSRTFSSGTQSRTLDLV